MISKYLYGVKRFLQPSRWYKIRTSRRRLAVTGYSRANHGIEINETNGR